MKKLFLLEYKKNLCSILFLLAVIILALIYITQCLPKKWMYYKEPMTGEEFIYETLKQDIKRGTTEEIKGYVINNNNNKWKRVTIYEKVYLEKTVLNFMDTILKKMEQNHEICFYDSFEEDMKNLNLMLGEDSYYEESSRKARYELYLTECLGTVPIENIHELCEEMYQYLQESIETKIYVSYSIDAFINHKRYSNQELEKVTEIAQDIKRIWEGDREEEIKYQNILMYFDEIDQILGKNTIFGESYLDQYFKKVYSLEDAKQQYKNIIEKEKLTNTYARYYTDYMTVFAGLLPAVFGALCLWHDERHKMQEVVFSKRISSFQYIFLKFATIIALFFTVYMIIAGISTGLFTAFAETEDIAIDFFAFFKYTVAWVMPTVCITTISSIFLFVIFWNPLPSLMVELVIFFLSAKDLCGNYFIWKPIIRFNEIGQYDYFLEHLQEIILNRIAMLFLSFLFLIVCSVLYERKRKGKYVNITLRRNR